MTLLLGFAQAAITPTLERHVFLAGFGQDRLAVSIHDDLYVRSLTLKDEHTTIALVSLDLIGFFRPDVLEVKRRVQDNFPEAKIIISSTHTHHGPDTMGLWGPNTSTPGVDSGYMTFLKDAITNTIIASLSSLEECDEVTATTIRITGMVKNPRDPEIIDDELILMRFLKQGNPRITIFNFACHPEVLWEHNPHITSDYPGYLVQEVEKADSSSCIFFSGALGGMLTPDVMNHSFEQAEQMGKSLAFSGMLALERPELVMHHPKISLNFKPFTVKLTNILYKLAFMRKLLPDIRDKKGYLQSEVGLVKIGDVWFASVPGELLPKLGLVLKTDMIKAGAKIAGVIGLANDELGYILPGEDFKYPFNPFSPGKHYEETNSVGKEIGPRVIEAVRSLL